MKQILFLVAFLVSAAAQAQYEKLSCDLFASTVNANGASTILKFSSDANRRLTFGASSDTAHTMTFGDGGTTAAQTFAITASTADADDDSQLSIGAGGVATGSRGGYISLKGNEHSDKGDSTVATGDASGSDLALYVASTDGVIKEYAGNKLIWTLEADGDIAQDATNGGNLVFAKVGTGAVNTLTTKTADGSSQADAVALTAVHFTLVAGADGSKGVKFPAYASYTIGQTILVHNNSASNLKLYSNVVTDLINDVAGTTAYTIAAHVTATCFKYDATHIYCG